MHFLFVVIILVTIPVTSSADLYFISAHPTPNSNVQYSSALFKYDNSEDAIKEIRSVVPSPLGTDNVLVDLERKIAVMQVWGIQFTDNDNAEVVRFKVIDFNKPHQEREYKVKFDKSWGMHRLALLDIPSNGLYLAYELMRSSSETAPLERSQYGLNLDTGKVDKLSYENHKYFRVSGAAFGIYPSGQYNQVQASKDGQLMARIAKTKTPIAIASYGGTNFLKGDMPVFVNNDHLLVVSSKKEKISKLKNTDYSTFYIYDKGRKEWQTFNAKGAETIVKGFDYWLAGTVTNKKNAYKIKDLYKYRLNSNRNTNIDQDMSDNELFLFNTRTTELLDIKTESPDSEVLLVYEDQVYIRDFDKIYKAQLANSKIEDMTLIGKGNEIVDVHWAFISN